MASSFSKGQLASETPRALAALLDVPLEDVVLEPNRPEVDLVVTAAGHTFVVEVILTTGAGLATAHASHVASAAESLGSSSIPVLVAPFMTDGGRRAAQAAGVCWLDLSGNGHLAAPGLRVIVSGQPNRFRPVGRPSSVFAPKSARVVRWLLEHAESAFTQREIARATKIGEGFVSRIVGTLEEERYLERAAGDGTADVGSGDGGGEARGGGTADGRHRAGKAPVRVRDPALLLEAWRDEYEFEKHRIIRGHVAARSGDALARVIGDAFGTAKIEHAATGLAAAWELTHFSGFRIATFFVAAEPPAELLASLGFRDDPRGANLWLVVPNDEGVFEGAEALRGLRCVHPVQAYVDLKAHPERANEAAERLRSEYLTWKKR